MVQLTPLAPVTVAGMTIAESELVSDLLNKLAAKQHRNFLRSCYYDGKHSLGAMTEVVPASYQRLGIVLGWTGKAVDLLARRCNLNGFVWPDGDLDELGGRQLWDDNMLGSEVDQAVTSSLLHSCAFAVAHKGGAGEPEAMIHFRDALTATGEWDPRQRRLTSFLSVTDRTDDGRISAFTLYVDGETIDVGRVDARWRVVDRRERAGTVPAEVLPYRPRLHRPFGASRISRPMMALQDQAVRELIRLEGHLDVYSWPEFWMLGADESVFTDSSGATVPRWQVMIGRIKGIPDDEDATTPRADVKQFPAASPQPHLAAANAFAKLFAREASLPDTALAITDVSNPTSAESYDASQYELIAEAEGATDDWSPGLRRIYCRALAIAHGETEAPAEWSSITTRWRDPRFQSRAAQADAGMKTLSAVPWLAETEIGLELLGLSADQVDRALGERRRSQGSSALRAIVSAAQDRQTALGNPIDQ